jgi:hypothetical protein
MLKKNIEKLKRKERPTWVGYYTRKTPTKKELLEKQARKDKANDRVHIHNQY